MKNKIKQREWSVYAHISPSNKFYIGITSRQINDRWRGKGVEYKSQYFYRAIQKYGWDNFQHEIIAEHLTENEAKNLEIVLIAKLQSNNSKYGYNITIGGDGVIGVKLSKEHKEALISSTSKPVYQFDKDMNLINEYSSARDAARKLGIKSKSGILNVCNGKLQTSNGYVWRFKQDIENPYDKELLKSPKYKYNQKGVYQIDISKKTYIEYTNAIEASDITGFEYYNIVACCTQKLKTCKGYTWRYKDDITDIDDYIKQNLMNDIGSTRAILQFDTNMNYVGSTLQLQKLQKSIILIQVQLVKHVEGKIKLAVDIFGDTKMTNKVITLREVIEKNN